MTTLGRRVEQYRHAKGLSRARLAADADVSYTLISQVERGGRDPSASNVAAIAAALGVSVDALLSDEEPVIQKPAGLPPRVARARKEILAIVETLSPEDLVIARDMLVAWSSRAPGAERTQESPAR